MFFCWLAFVFFFVGHVFYCWLTVCIVVCLPCIIVFVWLRILLLFGMRVVVGWPWELLLVGRVYCCSLAACYCQLFGCVYLIFGLCFVVV